jgi:energy-coupling factor transport system ATP-binding protein
MSIQFEKVNFKYSEGSSRERAALIDIDLNIELGTYISVIGHTGSGKSTLIQHMNALLQPSSGKVRIIDKEIVGGAKNKGVNEVRKRVGLVFQFPEYQLFEETVEKDIMFGPLNFGVSKEEARARAKEVISMVGLGESFLQRSPLNLSGGQMRRVAIAGILAMQPEVLILDEPTAGLDPKGQEEMMQMFYDLHTIHHKTIILISHDMNYVAKYAKRVLVMHQGHLAFDGTPSELFNRKDLLEQYQLDLPDITKLIYDLEERLKIKIDRNIVEVEQLATSILNQLK